MALELSLIARLAWNSEICLLLPSVCWAKRYLSCLAGANFLKINFIYLFLCVHMCVKLLQRVEGSQDNFWKLVLFIGFRDQNQVVGLSHFFFFNLKTILSWVKVADACDPSTREGRAGRSPRI